MRAKERRHEMANLITRSQYDSLDPTLQRKYLQAWKNDKRIVVADVLEWLKMTQGEYYEELKRHDIKTNYRKPRQKLASAKKLQSSCAISSHEGKADPIQLQEILTRIALQVNEEAEMISYTIRLEEISV